MDDIELRLVCLVTCLLVALPTTLLLVPRPWELLVGVPLALVLAAAVGRLVVCARRPDPWRAFDAELRSMGVVVAEPAALAGRLADRGRQPR